jgi:hypothetical protein
MGGQTGRERSHGSSRISTDFWFINKPLPVKKKIKIKISFLCDGLPVQVLKRQLSLKPDP